MSTVVVKTIIKFKRGTAAQWIDKNPVLHAGEPGFEMDTNRLKIGNGVDNWLGLDYFGGGEVSVEVAADGKSLDVKYIGGVKTFYMQGFDGAGVGDIPIKNSSGYIEWVNLDEEVSTRIEEATYTKTQIDSKLDDKQNKLIPGQNIKIENNVISSDNLIINGYYLNGKFYTNSTYTVECVKNINYLYVDRNTNGNVYTWDGVTYHPSVKNASESLAGILKLYQESGQNTDGTMTQKVITDGVQSIKFDIDENDTECLILDLPWD